MEYEEVNEYYIVQWKDKISVREVVGKTLILTGGGHNEKGSAEKVG